MVLRRALLGELPIVCHYKLLSEYSEVLFRMVRRGELAFHGIRGQISWPHS